MFLFFKHLSQYDFLSFSFLSFFFVNFSEQSISTLNYFCCFHVWFKLAFILYNIIILLWMISLVFFCDIQRVNVVLLFLVGEICFMIYMKLELWKCNGNNYFIIFPIGYRKYFCIHFLDFIHKELNISFILMREYVSGCVRVIGYECINYLFWRFQLNVKCSEFNLTMWMLFFYRFSSSSFFTIH